VDSSLLLYHCSDTVTLTVSARLPQHSRDGRFVAKLKPRREPKPLLTGRTAAEPSANSGERSL